MSEISFVQNLFTNTYLPIKTIIDYIEKQKVGNQKQIIITLRDIYEHNMQNHAYAEKFYIKYNKPINDRIEKECNDMYVRYKELQHALVPLMEKIVNDTKDENNDDDNYFQNIHEQTASNNNNNTENIEEENEDSLPQPSPYKQAAVEWFNKLRETDLVLSDKYRKEWINKFKTPEKLTNLEKDEEHEEDTNTEEDVKDKNKSRNPDFIKRHLTGEFDDEYHKQRLEILLHTMQNGTRIDPPYIQKLRAIEQSVSQSTEIQDIVGSGKIIPTNLTEYVVLTKKILILKILNTILYFVFVLFD